MKPTEKASPRGHIRTPIPTKAGHVITEEKIESNGPISQTITHEDEELEKIYRIFETAPPEVALEVLKEQLEGAALKHNEDPGSRAGVRIAMEIAAGFFMARLGLASATPFVAIFDGLKDLDAGVTPQLFMKKSVRELKGGCATRGGGRPLDTTSRKRMKALAAAACEQLIARGETVICASQKVSKILEKLNFQISSTKRGVYPTATTIKNWRDEVKKDPEGSYRFRLFLQQLSSASTDKQIEIAISSLSGSWINPHFNQR